MKCGTVVLIGRTNAGKSTLLNTILKQKVAITSPKPKTTQFSIRAVYEDDRGQIIFVDTPGMSREGASQAVDVVIYVIDQTRERGREENTAIGIMRMFSCPRILLYNKIDKKGTNYRVQYGFLEDEVDETLEVSALEGTHIKALLTAIFNYLPEKKPTIDTSKLATPLLSMDSKTFIAELIREKIYLNTGQEIPYQTRVEVDEIIERKNGNLYIKARVITSKDRYRKILIGTEARKIKEIGYQTRKELEVSTNKKVYLELTVVSNQ